MGPSPTACHVVSPSLIVTGEKRMCPTMVSSTWATRDRTMAFSSRSLFTSRASLSRPKARWLTWKMAGTSAGVSGRMIRLMVGTPAPIVLADGDYMTLVIITESISTPQWASMKGVRRLVFR